MKYLQKIVWALVALVLSTGCIKEDFDDCDNVTIYFQYLADGDKDVLYQYISKVDLYVFDENGHILGSGSYNQDELKNFAAIPSFKLTPGKRYKVVAVGNAYGNTEVVNVNATSFDDIFLQNPHWDDPERVTNHDDNYLGEHEFVMPVQEGVMYRDTVTLRSAHIDVSVEIHGLPAPVKNRQSADIPYELSIENSNAQCSFSNEINESEKGTVYPELIYDMEKQCYRTDDLALFRMDTGGKLDEDCCEHELVLTDKRTGNELVRGRLYDYLMANEDEIDVTKQEALLPVAIQFRNLDAEITVPDWVIVDGKPDWN